MTYLILLCVYFFALKFFIIATEIRYRTISIILKVVYYLSAAVVALFVCYAFVLFFIDNPSALIVILIFLAITLVPYILHIVRGCLNQETASGKILHTIFTVYIRIVLIFWALVFLRMFLKGLAEFFLPFL